MSAATIRSDNLYSCASVEADVVQGRGPPLEVDRGLDEEVRVSCGDFADGVLQYRDLSRCEPFFGRVPIV